MECFIFRATRFRSCLESEVRLLAMKAYGVEVWHHTFFTSSTIWRCVDPIPAPLLLVTSFHNRWVGGMGTRAGLDALERRKISCLCQGLNHDFSVFLPIGLSVYWMSCCGFQMCMCFVNLVGRYQDFGRTCCCHLPARKALFFAEDLGSVFHENDGTSLPSNMACRLGAWHHVNLQLLYTYALITRVTW